MAKKKKKWTKKRHAVIQRLAKFFLYPFVKIKYGANIEKTKDNRQRVIIANHQTAFDQFFIAYGYSAPVYYVASEDLFSNGFISKLLRWAINPIPIKKQASDIRAVMNCMQVVKEGGSIAIFPEGNRTFSGTTEYMSIAIVKLIKVLKLPLSFFIIRGGYGVQPRWSDKTRKGKINCFTSKTLEPEEYLKLSDEELYALIKRELYVDEREITEEYKSNRRAEYLERVMFVCPNCGITNLESNKNTIKCTACGKEIEYTKDKRLIGKGFNFQFSTVKEWYNYQNQYISSLDIEKYFDTPIFCDTARQYKVVLYKSKKLLNKKAKIITYGNRYEIADSTLNFSDISAVSVLGRNKLNIYYKDMVYQIKGNKRFNAVKYVNVFYKYKGYIKGDKYVEFLGL